MPLTELFAVENVRADAEEILEEARLGRLRHVTWQEQISKHLVQTITAHTCAPVIRVFSTCPVRNAPELRLQYDAAPPVQLLYPGEHRAAAAMRLPEVP